MNGVDGEIVDYEFTDKFKGEKKGGEWVYFVPQIKVDGADDAIDQHLFVGGVENYEISDDGKSLTMVDGSPVTFGSKVPFGRLMDSLFDSAEKADVDLESELPNLEDGEPLNVEPLIGRRFRFGQEVDEKANEKFGKRKGTGKNAKKEYDRTNTVITAILGEKGKGGSAKPAAGKKGKGKDATDEAADVLKDILAKGEVNRKNLSLPVTKALMKNPNKDELKKTILDQDWQDKQEWLTIDKKGNLSVED